MGEWTITRDGNGVRIGPDPEALLHALVMTEGEIDAEVLESVLPERADPNTDRNRSMKAALTKLRNDPRYRLRISEDKDPVTMSRDQPHASFDLWEFFELAELERYAEAAKLVAGPGLEPVVLEKYADHNKHWKPMLKKFKSVKEKVMVAVKGALGRNQVMREVRQKLLERSLVPGVGREISIREVRGAIEPIGIPWQALKPEADLVEEPLPPHLVGLLEEAKSQRVAVIGGHGMGKTLAAIATFLRLTDELENPDFTHEPRPVIYIDGEIEGLDPMFGTDEWLDEYMEKFDAVGHGRRIVIVSHADSFFLRSKRPVKEILGWRMFREGDVLLCCSEQFYAAKVQFADFATHVIKLEQWDPETQMAYATARFGEGTGTAFKAWLDADPTGARALLCRRPLHLTYLLPVIDEGGDALEAISKRWRLFEQLAHVRLDAAGHVAEEDERFNELAAIAHRFYRSDPPAEATISCSLEDLRDFLKLLDRRDLETRLSSLVNNTMLIATLPGGHEYMFEAPSWAWFFAACHLTRVLKSNDPPEPVLKAFAKHFSADVMEFCKEMLSEAMSVHEEKILASLRGALLERGDVGLRPTQLARARQQVGYLLALLGDDEIREELSKMIALKEDGGETDDMVREGILLGLKGGRLRPTVDDFGHRGGM
ncbi:MAG TPA: hypothetical protein VG816_02115 [Solirubrobacterales bacterium]|nr:hypothetical protein [Solirubrobacterales bacterium]